jgi:hypothetical protein
MNRSAAIGIALFLGSFVVFWSSPVLQVADSRYAMLLRENILSNHSQDLGAYSFPGPIAAREQSDPPDFADHAYANTYQLGLVHGHLLYLFPYGGSFLSLPLVAAANLVGWHTFKPDKSYDARGEHLIQKTIAALLMAAFVLIAFKTAHLLLALGPSAIIALAAGFGTQVWSTASRGVWSQTWLILLAAGIVFELLQAERDDRPIRPILLASLLGLMYFVRPTAAIPIVCVSTFTWLVHREQFFRFSITGAVWATVFAVWSEATFGSLLPGYYKASRLHLHGLFTALAGQMISPSRGFFVYVPIAAYVLYRIARSWDRLPYKKLAVLALLIVVLQSLALAGFAKWWGGASYGPRLSTDLIPWMVLLAVLGEAANASLAASTQRRAEIAVAVLLLTASVFLNARGALSRQTSTWNVTADIDLHPEHAFEWSRAQFLAGLI